MKRVLQRVIAIAVLIPIMAVAWLTLTENGLHWAYQRAESYLPAGITMGTLAGRLIGPITIRGAEFQQDGTLIKADQIILDWQPAALLGAKIDIASLRVKSLSIVLPPTVPPTEKTDQPLHLPEINLPWRMALKDVVVDGVSVSQNNQRFDLQQIRLSATTLFSQVDIDELSIKTSTLDLTLNGELHPTRNYRHALALRWQATVPTHAVIHGEGRLVGDIDNTHLKQQLSGPLQLTLDAQLSDLLDRLNWQGKVDVTAFNVAKLNEDWPAINGKLKLSGKGDLTTASLSGSLDGHYPELGPFDAEFALQRLADNSIGIEHLMLHTPVSDTRLTARGQWLPGSDGGNIDVALDWQNLRWPLTDKAWFNSAIGSGWIEGNLHQYRAGLATDRPWPEVPPSFWYAAADGNLDGLNFHSLRVDALKGESNAKGQLNWSPHLTWQAQIRATDIDPASYPALGPQWPGRLKASITSSGRIENGQLMVDADITQLSGKLRDYPVSLRSRLSWRDAGLDIHTFDFQSGTSQVSARGRIGETLKLNWSIDANELAELYPDAKGQLHAKGLVAGRRDSPIIDASFNGKALSLPGYAIGSIDGSLSMDPQHWQHVNIKLAAQALRLNDYDVQSLEVDADTHHLVAKAASEATTALVELKGDITEKGWRGRIERADIKSQQFADWQLKAPVKLEIGEQTVAADKLCWRSSQQASLCASLQRKDTAWQSHLELSQFPLLLLSPVLPPDLKLEGVADATAKLGFQAPGQLQARAHITLPPGTVSYPLLEGERDRWEYQGGKAEMVLNDSGLEIRAEIAMPNGDEFHGRFALPGLNPLALNGATQPLEATAHLKIHDLGLIEALIPEVYELRGEVALNLIAAGTLAQPKLSGQGHLLNSALRIPRLGLTVDQISLQGQSDDFEKLHFQLDAHSGEGNLAVQGQTRLDRSAGWPTEISIKGKDFLISSIPEAKVQVTPDLRVKIHHNIIDIQGDIHIPYAKLQPKDLTTAARVSDDVVIVNSHEKTVEKWSLFTQVRLTLGDRVTFYGFGFEGRFGGSLLLVDKPGQVTTATGELSIPEGRYRAYGQRLDVEHGRLLFTGGPVTNPGLDLRAVRHVNDVTAGLKVRGSLSQPQIELFSIPAMGQTDTLSYLMLGRPIENATGEDGAMMAKAALALGLSGGNQLARSLTDQFGLDEMRVESSDKGDQASLVMGRYLSPRLYVSYGVGLIEAFNTFTVRYQITDKWHLKAESGDQQGADIMYTIDR